ncbi:MAG: hypothetical protein MJ231_04165 [bacterium]|nr:hypothetical protein [bacterium]
MRIFSVNNIRILRQAAQDIGASGGSGIIKQAEKELGSIGLSNVAKKEGLKVATSPIRELQEGVGDVFVKTEAKIDTPPKASKIAKTAKGDSSINVEEVAKNNISEEDRANNKISSQLAKQIYKEYYPLYDKIDYKIQKTFEELITKEKIISEVHCRIKGDESIREKMTSRGYASKKEAIEKITDIIGFRTPLTKFGNDDIKKLTDLIIDKIKKGEWILREIEIKRPKSIENAANKELYDYIPLKFIDEISTEALNKKLKDAAEKAEDIAEEAENVIKTATNYTEANYAGVHFSFEIPVTIGDKTFSPIVEYQVYGDKLKHAKEIQDSSYKYFKGKNVSKKYRFLQPRLSKLKNNKNLLEIYQKYEKELMLEQIRKDKSMKFKSGLDEFLSWEQFIPELNKIDRIKLYSELDMLPAMMRNISPTDLRKILSDVPEKSVNEIIDVIKQQNEILDSVVKTVGKNADVYVEANEAQLNKLLCEKLRAIINNQEYDIDVEKLYDCAMINKTAKQRKAIFAKAAEKMKEYDYNQIQREIKVC